MTSCDAITRHLNELLDVDAVEDYCPNGVQVAGAAEVRRIVTGVTASLELIEAAVDVGAQMLVTHHGILWNGDSHVLRGHFRKRVKALLDAGVTLLAYHLPLDRHAEVGNNAPALRDLGVIELEPFAPHGGVCVGWKGRFPAPIRPSELMERLRRYYEDEPLGFLHGREDVRTIGLVSGAAQRDARLAVAEGLDAFVTGEVSEFNMHLAREEGFHHVSVGHHASERVGPRCLAEHLASFFGVETMFIDVVNPA